MIPTDHPDAADVFRAAREAADARGEAGSRVVAGLKALTDGTPATGRFEGDLYAALDHDPTERKPYRVRVWEWRHSYRAEVLPGWFEARNGIDGGFQHQKEFRDLHKAVSYLFEVRASAETSRLYKVVRASAESRREVLA